jgi:hypothetical protein
MNGNFLKILKPHLLILNQLFEIEEKVKKLQEANSINRNIDRMKTYYEADLFSEVLEYQGFSINGLFLYNPLGESFNETRQDCEATITGENYENLKIVEVIKPIIFAKTGTAQIVIQKGIVIVESTKKIQ